MNKISEIESIICGKIFATQKRNEGQWISSHELATKLGLLGHEKLLGMFLKKAGFKKKVKYIPNYTASHLSLNNPLHPDFYTDVYCKRTNIWLVKFNES